MKPRITINLTTDGQLEIWLNPQGRDRLVAELNRLSETNDHVHLAPDDLGEIELATRPYDPADTVIWGGKILFRLDEWDERYFPHVMRSD